MPLPSSTECCRWSLVYQWDDNAHQRLQDATETVFQYSRYHSSFPLRLYGDEGMVGEPVGVKYTKTFDGDKDDCSIAMINVY